MEEVKHFLEVEIKRCRNVHPNDPYNSFYDGVWVGLDDAQTLRRRHISFCERLLKMIEEAEKCPKN